MPYESVKVRELLRAAPQHSRMPNGEYVNEMAEQLSFAESELAKQAVQVRKAHEETSAVQLRLDAEVDGHRKLREATAGHAQCVAALKVIAVQPKGAAKVAAEALKAAGIVLETPAVKS